MLPFRSRTPADLPDFIKTESDQCVKCGLCLPHCPTYALTRDEGDSPRGRIALMQALVEQQLPAGGRLDFHLDRCLGCRACERVCPSRVRYGQLIDAVRALEAPAREASGGRTARRGARPGRWLRDRVAPERRRVAILARLLRVYRYSGLRWLARASGLLRLTGLRRLDALMPAIPAPPHWRAWYPPTTRERGRVALFTGCVGNVLDREALEAAIRVLNACGYGVHVPPAQTCCGALALHDGDPVQAAMLARSNLAAFDALDGIDAIVHVASGCGVTLAEYDTLPVADPPAGFAAPVHDISTFLERHGDLDRRSFAPLARDAVVHDPCTLANVIRGAEAPYRLLARIPELRIEGLAGNDRCCGAAGSYLLTQPEMADRLRDDKLDAMQATGATLLLTSNTGCAMSLAAGMRERGRRIEVLHPVTLLARQLAA